MHGEKPVIGDRDELDRSAEHLGGMGCLFETECQTHAVPVMRRHRIHDADTKRKWVASVMIARRYARNRGHEHCRACEKISSGDVRAHWSVADTQMQMPHLVKDRDRSFLTRRLRSQRSRNCVR
jgi:hypothetical protein